NHPGFVQYATCLRDDVGSDVRRYYRLLGAIKNLHAQLFFELLNLHTERRLCHKTTFGSQGEMPQIVYATIYSSWTRVIDCIYMIIKIINLIYFTNDCILGPDLMNKAKR